MTERTHPFALTLTLSQRERGFAFFSLSRWERVGVRAARAKKECQS